jgi:SAM-dependent methyltransferase
MRNVLHVGCGSSTIANMPPGFRDGSWRELRFDIDPTYNVDFVGTMTDMQAVESESMDALYSSHNIEHVYAHEVEIVLREFRRVLKPDGFAVVTCPDLVSVAKHIAEGRLEDPLYQSPTGPISALDIFYGHGAAIAQGQVYMAHRTGFTQRTLGLHGQAAGFARLVVRVRPQYFDLWMVASKGEVSDARLGEMLSFYTKS